jgi:hypothetical protein
VCFRPILSRLFLLCHVVFVAFGYGLCSIETTTSEVSQVVNGVLRTLMPPLRALLSSDTIISKNIDIICEMHCVLMMAQRYLLDLDQVLPNDYFDLLFGLSQEALEKNWDFMPGEGVEDFESLRHVPPLL